MVNGRQRSDQIGHQTTKFQHLIVTSSKRQHVLAIALAQPLLLYQIREQHSLFLGGALGSSSSLNRLHQLHCSLNRFPIRPASYWQVVIELAKKFWEWSPELWRGYWLVTCRCLLAGRSIFRNSSISVCACILVQQSTTQTLYRVIDRTFAVSKKLRAFTLILNGMRRI